MVETRKIIIGRYGQEGVDSQVLVSAGMQESRWGQMGSVPQSVSRQHCCIEIMGNGYLIRNLNPRNVTYVNGQPVASQVIGMNDVVELGQTRYRLDWAIVRNFLPSVGQQPTPSFNPQPSAKPTLQPSFLPHREGWGGSPQPSSSNTLLAMIVGAAVLIGVIAGIVAYINQSSSSRSYDYSSSTSSYSSSDTYDDKVEYDEPSSPTESSAAASSPRMVSCPMCNGTGIFDYGPGDMMAPKERCSGCNGTGLCDENTAQNLMEMKRRVDAVMGGGSGGYSSGGAVGESTISCGMCNGSGYYHWYGTPRYSGSSDPQWTNCMNCGEVIDAYNSHSCRCRKCNGTGQI